MNTRFLPPGSRGRGLCTVAALLAMFLTGWLTVLPAEARQELSPASPLAHLAGGEPGQQDTLQVQSEPGKTWLNMPVDEQVIVSPEYDHPELLLHFDPGVEPVPVQPLPEGSLVESVEYAGTGAVAETVSLTVSEPIQFLLSKPTKGQLRVLLVPQKQQAAVSENKGNGPRLNEIEFTQDRDGRFYIKLYGSSRMEYVTQPGPDNQVRILLPGLTAPSEYTKLYRLNKFDSVVRTALLENTGQGVELNLSVSERVPFNAQYGSQSLVLVFDPAADDGRSRAQEGSSGSQGSGEADESDLAQENMNEFTALFPGMKTNYTGRKISIDLQDAEVEHVLRLIAEVSGYNLIIDDAVSGTISLKLEDVPWDQALDLVLLQRGLGMVVRGNIMRIASAEQLTRESDRIQQARQQAIQAQESREALAPLQTEYIQINYTTANQLVPQVSPFLTSERNGVSINSDSRTNLLIVRDTEAKIDTIRRVIQKLDRPERQVLIEARIISATDDFQKGLGLKWGGGFEHTSSDGDLVTGIGGTEGSTGTPTGGLSLSDLAVNLPNQGPTTLGLGGFISKLTGQDLFTLDAQLQLGEEKNLTRIISSPRIVTLNNQRAEIQQGTLVASQAESESGGTTTEYTEAVLKLSVLPQITPDNKLILELEISDDSPAPTGDDISTRTARTRLIVNNEETIVLGGVHKSTERDNQSKVPGLGNVPLFGWAFKNKFDSRNQEELLVFIRPKILD